MIRSNDYASLVNLILEFYRYENARNWEGIATLVSSDIVAESYPSGDIVVGKYAYLKSMVEMYHLRDETLTVLSISADVGASTVHSELIIGGKTSVNVFELNENLILREREYLGAGYERT